MHQWYSAVQALCWFSSVLRTRFPFTDLAREAMRGQAPAALVDIWFFSFQASWSSAFSFLNYSHTFQKLGLFASCFLHL